MTWPNMSITSSFGEKFNIHHGLQKKKNLAPLEQVNRSHLTFLNVQDWIHGFWVFMFMDQNNGWP
jgi:hypothetical protein